MGVQTFRTFTVTDDHLKLVKRFNIGWNDDEFGSPSVDCKKPFGNSSVYEDMAEILGITLPDSYDEHEKYDMATRPLNRLYYEDLPIALQILCCNLSLEAATYVAEGSSNNWEKLK